jgi:hypothetical protein
LETSEGSLIAVCGGALAVGAAILLKLEQRRLLGARMGFFLLAPKLEQVAPEKAPRKNRGS